MPKQKKRKKRAAQTPYTASNKTTTETTDAINSVEREVESQKHSRKYLSTHKPSDPSWNKNNESWIFVQNPNAEERSFDQMKAFQLWNELQTSQVAITAEKIKDIAVQSNVTVGKWMIFRERSMIDDTWQMISEATIAGKLGCSSKVSTVYESDRYYGSVETHLICVYTDNYADKDDVMRVERQLRSLGITGVLYYKPDIYTYFGIYYNNPYKIRASVYTSKE